MSAVTGYADGPPCNLLGPAAEIVNILGAQRVPTEQVMTPDRMYDLTQLDARGYYEEVEHPVTGRHR